jgi:hypothetical protein
MYQEIRQLSLVNDDIEAVNELLVQGWQYITAFPVARYTFEGGLQRIGDDTYFILGLPRS